MSLLLFSITAGAGVTNRDLQVVARTLGFLETPLTGNLNMGIIYDPANTSSRQQAQQIAAELGAGLRVGNLQLRPVLVPLAEAASARVDFFLMSEFLGASASVFAAHTGQRKLPCVTTDLQQVRDGHCAIGVQSAPKVSIVVNRAAAATSAIRFSTVFRMMITEL
jgi:hypothetical protein